MKYVLIILAIGTCFYIYKYFNDRQMEAIKAKRTEELRREEPLEFNRSLYKVRAARARIQEQLEKVDPDEKLKFNVPQNPEEIQKKEEIRDLKKDEPSIPAPIENEEKYTGQERPDYQQDENRQSEGQEQ